MSKGQTSYPFTMAEAALTFLLVLGVAYGSQGFTETFIKEELTDIQAERMRNSAMAVDSLPEGYIQIDQDFSGYEYKVEGGELTVSFRQNNKTIDVAENVSVNNIDGPDSFTEMETICVEKTLSTIEFRNGGC